MSEAWDAEAFSVPDISWQALVPPARHPVPVNYVADLGVGDEVTIGVPGRYFIDGQIVAFPERNWTRLAGEAEEATVAVAAPFAYWLAKGFPQAGLTMQWWPMKYCWMYQDAATAGEQPGAHIVAYGDQESWLDHVQATLNEPPVRQAQPARAASSLTGRTVRLQHERGVWSWWIAVSEPVNVNGDFVVHAMRPSDYWLAQAACEPIANVEIVPLHRFYAYG